MASSVSGPPSWNRTIPKHLAVCDIPTGSPESDRMLTRFRPVRQTLLYKSRNENDDCESVKRKLIQLVDRQVVTDRKDNEFNSRRDARFVKNVAQVMLHRVLGDAEAVGNFLVRPSGNDSRCNLQFSLGEPIVVG